MQAGARYPAIAPDGETKRTATRVVCGERRAQSSTHALGHLIGQIAIRDATDVVLAKDVGRDSHGRGGLPVFPRA